MIILTDENIYYYFLEYLRLGKLLLKMSPVSTSFQLALTNSYNKDNYQTFLFIKNMTLLKNLRFHIILY